MGQRLSNPIDEFRNGDGVRAAAQPVGEPARQSDRRKQTNQKPEYETHLVFLSRTPCHHAPSARLAIAGPLPLEAIVFLAAVFLAFLLMFTPAAVGILAQVA